MLGTVAGLIHRKVTGVHPPKGFLGACAILGAILLLGTLLYPVLEGWTYFDSFYFTMITITTVGYGDLHPTTDASKALTLVILFSGVGVGLYVLSTFAQSMIIGRERRLKKLEQQLDSMRG